MELEPIDQPIDLGADAVEALVFAKMMGIVEGLTNGLNADALSGAMTNLVRLFEKCGTTDGALLPSASWLITARKQ